MTDFGLEYPPFEGLTPDDDTPDDWGHRIKVCDVCSRTEFDGITSAGGHLIPMYRDAEGRRICLGCAGKGHVPPDPLTALAVPADAGRRRRAERHRRAAPLADIDPRGLCGPMRLRGATIGDLEDAITVNGRAWLLERLGAVNGHAVLDRYYGHVAGFDRACGLGEVGNG